MAEYKVRVQLVWRETIDNSCDMKPIYSCEHRIMRRRHEMWAEGDKNEAWKLGQTTTLKNLLEKLNE